MLKPFCFGWGKILPILYDNYLSETEILNEIISRYNQFIAEINMVENAIDELDERVAGLGKEIDGVKADIQSLYAVTAEINGKIESIKAELEAQVEQAKQELESMLDASEEKLQEKIDAYTAQSERMFDKIENDFLEWQETARIQIEKIAIKVDTSNRALIKVISNNYFRTLKYVDEKVKTIGQSIMVVSPVTGMLVPVQQALDEIFNYYSHGLTAREYRQLGLTAEQYRLLNLTAYQYRMYGITREMVNELYGYEDPGSRRYDMFGQLREDPVSSVFSALNMGVDADMDGYGLTAEEYRQFSDLYGAHNLDMYGRLILANHAPAYRGYPAAVISDPAVLTTADRHIRTVIRMPDDVPGVNSQELLTDEVMETLELTKHFDISVSDGTQLTGSGITLYNEVLTPVDGGIAYDADCIISLEKDGGGTDGISIVLDMTGICYLNRVQRLAGIGG